MADVLENFLVAMGFGLFEFQGDGLFRAVTRLPGWFQEIWDVASSSNGSIALLQRSPFLENFIVDAEHYWDSPGPLPCESETWIEQSRSGRHVPLQARALLLDGKRLLALSSPDPQFREQVKILQTARNALLDHERLGREIQKKEILLHCIVHDLSQPLSVMHVAMESLSEEAISDRSKQFLKLGKLASDQQETMIRDILRTFSGDLRSAMGLETEGKSSPDLLECARRTMTALGPTFETKGVTLRTDAGTPPGSKWPVLAEESRLERIFSNLLENALRYTPAGAKVTVGVEDEGDWLKAYVDDEGPGIPPDLRPEQIFGLFMKGKQGGGKAGLGLYFCRITVERWGGSIGCVGLPEKGSRFWFRLRRAEGVGENANGVASRKAGSAEAAVKMAAVGPLRILFADDQEDIRTLTSYQLKKSGHKVVLAKNGKEALKASRTGKFDVILLDQEMPGMTGEEVARAIRGAEAGRNAHVFLIASTGHSTTEDVKRMEAAGFDRVLGKPFRLEELKALLSAAPQKTGLPAPTAKQIDSGGAQVSELIARVGGDEKLLMRMIGTFLRDTPKRMAGMAEALRRKDAEELASLAHALKGSVSIFGAAAARDLAGELQELGRNQELASAGGVLANLQEEIAKLQGNLRGYAKQGPAKPVPRQTGSHKTPPIRGKRRR